MTQQASISSKPIYSKLGNMCSIRCSENMYSKRTGVTKMVSPWDNPLFGCLCATDCLWFLYVVRQQVSGWLAEVM